MFRKYFHNLNLLRKLLLTFIIFLLGFFVYGFYKIVEESATACQYHIYLTFELRKCAKYTNNLFNHEFLLFLELFLITITKDVLLYFVGLLIISKF